MAVGSHCLFTATVELTEPTAVFPAVEDFDPTWAETRDPDNVYSINSGNIRVAEAGRYLVTVGLRFNSIVSRLAIHTRCRQNVTVIEKSYAVGNARQSANQNIFTKSEFMIDLAANDDIDIQWGKKDINTGSLSPANTYIQLVRLTDDANTAYASYSDGTDTADYDLATPAPVPFDTIDEETDTSVIQQVNDDEFLLKGVIGDRFLVLASVYFEGGVTPRFGREMNATLDGAQIHGVGSQFLTTTVNISDGSLNVSFIVTKKINSDETLRILIDNKGDSIITLVRSVNRSGLHIMKLLSSTEIAMFHDATGNEEIENTTQLLSVWRNEDDRDAASFVQTDVNTLTIQKTGTYICGANVHGDRPTNIQRSNYMGDFVVNGTEVIEGNHGCYSKQSPGIGFNLLGILEISATQTLEVQTVQAGGGGAGGETTPNRTGAWAINADTLVFIPLIKTVNETVNIIEDELDILTILKLIAETVNISEQQNISLTMIDIVNEIVNISEQTDVVRSLIRTVNETLEILENSVKARIMVRILSETVNISENSNQTIGLIKILDETINIQEAVDKKLIKTISVNESVDISEDDIINVLELSIVINEVENTSETILSPVVFVKIIDELVNISESDLLVRVFSKQANEEINIVETRRIDQFLPRFFLTFRSRILKGEP